jgi:hypothetical protein
VTLESTQLLTNFNIRNLSGVKEDRKVSRATTSPSLYELSRKRGILTSTYSYKDSFTFFFYLFSIKLNSNASKFQEYQNGEETIATKGEYSVVTASCRIDRRDVVDTSYM